MACGNDPFKIPTHTRCKPIERRKEMVLITKEMNPKIDGNTLTAGVIRVTFHNVGNDVIDGLNRLISIGESFEIEV